MLWVKNIHGMLLSKGHGAALFIECSSVKKKDQLSCRGLDRVQQKLLEQGRGGSWPQGGKMQKLYTYISPNLKDHVGTIFRYFHLV